MIKKSSLIAILILILLFAWPAKYIDHFFYRPIASSVSIKSFKVYPGEPTDSVILRLKAEKIIHHPFLFNIISQILSEKQKLNFGEYQITSSTTPIKLLQNMISGTGLVQHKITFIEGWTVENIRAALTADVNLKQTIEKTNNQSIASLFESNAPKSAEGLFYPDTYFFTWQNTDISVLKTAFAKMQSVLNQAWKNREPNLPYQTPYQALIVASLIQRETAVEAEKPIIASVIINRLKKNMRLQIDPTVQFGLNKTFKDVITQKDLETKTPYNTYLISGLPPTPICMPSKSAIIAALNPAQTNYLYYVANGLGGHVFSETYAEHLKAVEQYYQKENNAKKFFNHLENSLGKL